MVTLSTNGAAIIFDFVDSQHYLYGTGQVIAPLNSLALVVENDGKSVTFKKGISNDIFVSVPIEEIDGMDAEALIEWWQQNAVGESVSDGIQFKVVTALPTVGSPKFIYLLQSPEGWSEWAYQQGEWISFGTLQTLGYEGKEAIQIAKSATTASAYTVALKIDPASNTAITQSNAGLKLTVEPDVKINSASTRPVETREVYKRFDELEIQSAQTVSSTTYQLYSLDEAKPVKMEVPFDQYVSAITVDNDEQQIVLDLKKADGTVQKLSGDATEVIFENDVKKGLEVVNHELNVKIDPASNSGLTVSLDGVKSTVETDVKVASASTRPLETKEIYKRFSEIEIQSGETVSSTTYDLYTLDEKRDVQIEVPNDQYVSAITVDNDNQQIVLDLKKADGTVQKLSGDATEVVFEDDIKKGLEVVNHEVNVKIDPASNSALTVSIDGVKLDAENNVKTASSSTRPVQTDEVFRRFDALEIKSGETVSSTTYALWSLDEEKPVKVNVPNDQYTSAITVDNTNQQILLDLKKADGSVQVLSGDGTQIIWESDLKDGLTADSHTAKVLIDPTSNSALTVSLSGVKLDVEPDVKLASASTRPVETKEVYKRFNDLKIESSRTDVADVYNLWSLDEEKDKDIEVKDTFQVYSALPASGDAEVLYILETTNAETSAKTYTQWIYRDSEWVQTSSNATGGNTYSAGTNIDIYKAQPTDDFYTISGSQVVDLTQAEYDALAVKNPDKIYNLIDAEPYILSAYTNIEIASALTEDNQTVHRLSAKDYQVVSALPASGTSETIYLLEKTDGDGAKYYEANGYISDAWQPIREDMSGWILDCGTY